MNQRVLNPNSERLSLSDFEQHLPGGLLLPTTLKKCLSGVFTVRGGFNNLNTLLTVAVNKVVGGSSDDYDPTAPITYSPTMAPDTRLTATSSELMIAETGTGRRVITGVKIGRSATRESFRVAFGPESGMLCIAGTTGPTSQTLYPDPETIRTRAVEIAAMAQAFYEAA